IVISLGYYGAGTAPHGWFDGDINGDGKVDGNDLGIIIGAGTYDGAHTGPAYGAGSRSKTTPTLTLPRSTTRLSSPKSGGGDKPDTVAQSCVVGYLQDGNFGYIYYSFTGELIVDYNGDTRITTAKPLQRLVLQSTSGRFITGNLNTSGFS